ncbi:hypothetical protein A5N15_11470 [Rothia kristinae]|uniref:Cell division protein FtsL n=1 Tax=Rothia kristinae TaxID=37923 RepID=A0A657ITD9_9MICC|nr:hypothetical protein A5N15_11470 [Rothia kristinae]
MSAELQQPDSAHDDSVSPALHLQAVRQRRLRLVGGGAQEGRDLRGCPGDRSGCRSVDRLRPRPPSPAGLGAGTGPTPQDPADHRDLPRVLLTLGFALLMNITISQNQYDLVQLRAQEQDLTERNQALSQEIEFQQAPQNLAARASPAGDGLPGPSRRSWICAPASSTAPRRPPRRWGRIPRRRPSRAGPT